MKVYVLAMMKNEGDILKEWIEHYKLFGVDHIYLINDNSTDESLHIASEYKDYVTVYNALNLSDKKGRQILAYNTYFKHLIGKDAWALICDIDEFIFPVKVDTFQKLFTTFSNCNQITMAAHNFGFMPNKTQPNSIVENNLLRSKTVVEITNTPNWIMKSCVRLNKIDTFTNVHRQHITGNTISASTDIVRYHHYLLQSEEHIIKRLMRGGGDKWRLPMNRNDAEKSIRDRNWDEYHEVTDTTLKDIHARLRSL